MELFFDGWYAVRGDARRCLRQCEGMGAVAIGIVESKAQAWGLLYWASKELFANHRIDSHNAASSVLRVREE